MLVPVAFKDGLSLCSQMDHPLEEGKGSKVTETDKKNLSAGKALNLSTVGTKLITLF